MKLYEKPVDRVEFEGKTYPIDADFRNVLRSQDILADNAYLPHPFPMIGKGCLTLFSGLF